MRSSALMRHRAAQWLGRLYLASGTAMSMAGLLVRGEIRLHPMLPTVPAALAVAVAILWLLIGWGLIRRPTIHHRMKGAAGEWNSTDRPLWTRDPSAAAIHHRSLIR